MFHLVRYDAGGFGGGHARDVVVTLPAGGGEANTVGQSTVTVTAPSRGCHDITAQIEEALAPGGAVGSAGSVSVGWLNVFIQHTSASLTVSDNRPTEAAGKRLEAALNRTVGRRKLKPK